MNQTWSKAVWWLLGLLAYGVCWGYEVTDEELDNLVLDPLVPKTMAEIHEEMRIPDKHCPKGLPPAQNKCTVCPGENPLQNPPLKREYLGKLEVLGEAQLEFSYNIQSKESDNSGYKNNLYPREFKTQLVKNNKEGYFACVNFPKDKLRHYTEYKETNLCISLPFKKGVNPSKDFLENPENFQILETGVGPFGALNNWCSHLSRTYHERSPSGVAAFGLLAPQGAMWALDASFLSFTAYPSRQLIPFHRQTTTKHEGAFDHWAEYYCLSLIPQPNMVKNKAMLSGDFHACFRVGPMEYKKAAR